MQVTRVSNIRINQISTFKGEKLAHQKFLAGNLPVNQVSTKEEKESTIVKCLLGLTLLASIIGIFLYHRKGSGTQKTIESPKPPKQPVKPIEEIKIFTEKGNNPRQILNVTEAEAREQLSKYRELKQWCNENIDWHNFKVGEGAHKVFLEEYRPLEKQVKANNISIIERKIFSINPLEDIEAKHQYIHYEVIPNAGFNESSFLDALDMFELYGKRESYQGIGISTISEMLSSLPTDPSSETVERMIKICGKHVTPLRYPDERDGAPNSLTYVQNYLVAFSKPGVLHTEEQVKLFLDNGRTMFWNDGHIDELANVLMVDKNALFKGNEKVRSMLDEMFECAAKNREPYLSERSMQVHLKFWKNLDKHYKRS